MKLDNSTEYTVDRNSLPGFWHALALIIVGYLISLLLSPIFQLLGKIGLPQSWSLFLNYTFTFSILLIIAAKYWRISPFAFQKTKLWLYLLLIPLIICMLIVAEAIISLLPMPDAVLRFFEEMVNLDLAGYLVVGISAPILEEFIFRGVFLKGFLKKYDAKKAIIWSALIFGIFHMNPWQFIPAFLIGLVIGWLYYKTKSLLPGLFIHFLNNSLSFYMAYKFQDINIGIKDIVGGNPNFLYLLIISIFIGLSILYVLRTMLDNKNVQTLSSK